MLLMLLSNLKCEIKTEIEKRKGANVNKGRLMLLWKFAVCDSKKQEEASGLLSNIGIKTILSKIPVLGPLLFWSINTRYKMNKHSTSTIFTYNTYGPFMKNKERIQKFKETEDSQYIYQNQL